MIITLGVIGGIGIAGGIIYSKYLTKKKLNEFLIRIDVFNYEFDEIKKEYITLSKLDEIKKKYKELFNKINNRGSYLNYEKVSIFIQTYITLNDIILKSNDEFLKDYYIEIDCFYELIDKYKKEYFSYNFKIELEKTYQIIIDKINKYSDTKKINDFIIDYNNLTENIKIWNKEFIKTEMDKYNEYFSNISGKNLDYQQREAIVVDEVNNLILAGAGCGKTLTIASKVKYLIEKKGIKPNEILLISFTKKAANEMSERITLFTEKNIQANTFHKLGFDITTRHNNERKDVVEDNELATIIRDYLRNHVFSNEEDLKNIIYFFGYYFNNPINYENLKSIGELYERLRGLNLADMKERIKKNKEGLTEELKHLKKSLKYEQMKSIEEVVIANYFYLNGIEYEYEKKYIFNNKSSNDKLKKSYQPDFYLPEYDIWLEHFGITEEYTVPWLSKVEEEKYLDGIKWKRETHKNNKTKLLETYSYYNSKGILLKKLEELVIDNNIKKNKVDLKEIYINYLMEQTNKDFEEFQKLIRTFITLFKSKEYNNPNIEILYDEIDKLNNSFDKERTKLFLDIVKPIYKKYTEYLKEHNKIDFNDMINEAIKIAKEKEDDYFIYKYIIIDEYQDVSFSKFNLIKEIRDKTNAKIFCVGDDWQSIYRFAGSDLSIFTDFEKNFGYTKTLKIEKTYRNSQNLIDVAGKFITKNTLQLDKNLVSGKENIALPINIYLYYDYIETLNYVIEQIINEGGENILILGRNNHDINHFEESGELKIKKNKDTNKKTLIFNKFPNINITFMTVHSSKGLEEENVILLNLENKRSGFPNQMNDDKVLSLVLSKPDDYIFSEERRLFYVALTRTKNKVYLLAPENQPSIFVNELIKDFNIKTQKIKNTIENNENEVLKLNEHTEIICPVCKTGHLVIRENNVNNEKFLGCSNYPLCDNSYDIKIIDDHLNCTICGDYMIKKTGKYGEFYGCKNSPKYCKNTLSLSAINKELKN